MKKRDKIIHHEETHLWCPKCGTFDNPSYSTRFIYSKKKRRYGVECFKCGLSTEMDYVDIETARRSWIALGNTVLAKAKEEKKKKGYYESGSKWGYGMELEEYANEVYGGDLLDW